MPKWQIVTVYAPETSTIGETFVWHRPLDRLQVGVALLWKQGAFRGLANYELIAEKAHSPNLRVGFGLQGIGTGNPGFFATTEKTHFMKEGAATGYVGFGFRANEGHGHPLAGIKFTPKQSPWTVGFQHDGHAGNLFGSYRIGQGWSAGAYWISMKSLGLMVSWSK